MNNFNIDGDDVTLVDNEDEEILLNNGDDETEVDNQNDGN